MSEIKRLSSQIDTKLGDRTMHRLLEGVRRFHHEVYPRLRECDVIAATSGLSAYGM